LTGAGVESCAMAPLAKPSAIPAPAINARVPFTR
jgi:hypothetical protein